MKACSHKGSKWQKFSKWRVNQDQTYNRFNVYCLLTKWSTLGCFWRLQLVYSLSGFHVRFYDKIHIRLKMIFNVFFAVSAIFFYVHYHFSASFALDLSRCFGNCWREIVRQSINQEIFLTSIGHAGNLPYPNKTNKLRKIEYIVVKAKTNNLTWWFDWKLQCLFIY